MLKPHFPKLIIISAIAVSILASAIPVAAQSATPVGVTLSPVNYTGNFRPGELINTSFQLTDNTDSTLDLSLTAVEIRQGQLLTDASSAAAWTTIDQHQLHLAPAATADVKVTVAVPSDAANGAYFPAVLVSLGNPTGNDNSASVDAKLTFQMGVNITSELPTSSVKVTKLIVDNPVLMGRTNITYEITNPLTLFIKPIAYLQIINAQGVPVYRFTLNDTLAILKPGETLSGTVTADLPMNIGAIGQYRAELLAVDKQFSGSDILKTNFWVVPIWIPLGVVVAIVLIWMLGTSLKKAAKRRKSAFQTA